MTIRPIGISHIGLAPKDPEKARWFLKEALGLSHLGDELVLDQKVLTAMYLSDTTSMNHPATRLEILIPQPAQEGPIADFLQKRGSGIHHLAVRVENVAHAIDHLKSLGVDLIDQTPRKGAHNTLIAFVHPRSTGGLLVELVQES